MKCYNGTSVRLQIIFVYVKKYQQGPKVSCSMLLQGSLWAHRSWPRAHCVSIRWLGTVDSLPSVLPRRWRRWRRQGSSWGTSSFRMLEEVSWGGPSPSFFRASSLLMVKIWRCGEGLDMPFTSFFTSWDAHPRVRGWTYAHQVFVIITVIVTNRSLLLYA